MDFGKTARPRPNFTLVNAAIGGLGRLRVNAIADALTCIERSLDGIRGRLKSLGVCIAIGLAVRRRRCTYRNPRAEPDTSYIDLGDGC